MDEELFELCREVYKRFPEWKTGRHIWSMKRPVICKGDDFMDGMSFPLYTSDYLLEKLGDAELQEVSLYRCHHHDSSMNWCAIYDEQEFGGAKLFEYHDTPLKALLKLAIALDDAGVKL